MKLPSKKTIIYGIIALTVLFIVPKIWHVGIPIENQEKIDARLKPRIAKTLHPDARIINIHLSGEGAARKVRYCSIRYLLPEDDYSRFIEIDVDARGKNYDMQSPPIRDGITYQNGISLEEIDFSNIAANMKRIRKDFETEGVTWMGLQEYTIEYNLKEQDFIHIVKVYYETESEWNKLLRKIGFIVIPNESVTYTIRQNGTGEPEREKEIKTIKEAEEEKEKEENTEEKAEGDSGGSRRNNSPENPDGKIRLNSEQEEKEDTEELAL